MADEPSNKAKSSKKVGESLIADHREQCGIVMPISELDGLSVGHWMEVREILVSSIEAAGFRASMVSHASPAGVIHKSIVQNLYSNPIVVCDVSGANPNVMLELGMRLVFDRPVVIVGDDKTQHFFDIGPIERLKYPRDLRHSLIEEFKELLTEKVKATAEAGKDPGFSPFLKHFGEFKVPKLTETKVDFQEFMVEKMRDLEQAVKGMQGKSEPIARTRHERRLTSTTFSRIISAIMNRISTTGQAKSVLKDPALQRQITSDIISELGFVQSASVRSTVGDILMQQAEAVITGEPREISF